jgi:hypothetical protein
MNFLAGWGIIALAAGLTVPPLVALYFLKLKRKVEPIPSTLLWKRAVEDLTVNAPFQRLRRNLLLLLQLLVLLLAAIALGKPIFMAPRSHEGKLILLIDHSASMNVQERPGRTRLDLAKEQAKRAIDNMKDGTQAMLVSFNDKATIVASFNTDRSALKAKIDTIKPTESLSTLTEAIALAEAHASDLVIEDDGGSVMTANTEAAGNVLLFTDGRIEDAEQLAAQRFRAESMEIVTVGSRTDNVGITGMEARRSYERPSELEVFAEVRNFGPESVEIDANLYIDDSHVDVKTLRLAPGLVVQDSAGDAATEPDGEPRAAPAPPTTARQGPPPGSLAAVAFDALTYEGGGVVEVRLAVDDALAADDRAWAVIRPPRHTDVLLVTAGNLFLERVLRTLPLRLEVMTPETYESVDEDRLVEAKRSQFDLVILDRHSTDRLPPGNYFFWNGVPRIEGVDIGDTIEQEIIVNWDETHPILRHVPVEAVDIFAWDRLILPPESILLIEGETGPVLAYLAREGREYLIAAFSLLTDDTDTGQPMLNTFWVTKAHFPVFMYNAVQYLTASLTTQARKAVRPGEPVTVPVLSGGATVKIRRPDGTSDTAQAVGSGSAPFGRTRQVGLYRVVAAPEGDEMFAVNLFSPFESLVAPNERFRIGADLVRSAGGIQKVSKPVWPYLLAAALVILLLEWVVYNKRVFV